jgi:hypothetical protein
VVVVEASAPELVVEDVSTPELVVEDEVDATHDVAATPATSIPVVHV